MLLRRLEFGTTISSFLTDRTWVTWRRISLTSPKTSPTWIRSPRRKARRYVIEYPAMMFAMNEDEPIENMTPRKIEMLWKAAEREPGM